MTPETLGVYAEDLSTFGLADIEVVLDKLGRAERRDGESAMPAIGTIFDALRGHLRIARDNTALNEIKAREQHFRDNPEMYETPAEVKEMVGKLAARFNMDKPKEPVDLSPVMMSCPHCNQDLPVAHNVRFWSIDELKAHVALLESSEYAAMKEAV